VNKRRRFKVKRRRALRKRGVGAATLPWWMPALPVPSARDRRRGAVAINALYDRLMDWPPRPPKFLTLWALEGGPPNPVLVEVFRPQRVGVLEK
jgi:hypothetical protein